ncbi:MAG: thioesterase family protein [Methanobacteriaceae archaeon]|nr:thioesterase family protein [Methanobacteriaceae archaeon]
MFKETVVPKFGDIDGLRHVNNTRLAEWFEMGRNPYFRMFTPDLDLSYKNWKLIMVRTDFNFLRQMYYQYNIEIRSYIQKIGNTSFTLRHEAWQEGELKADGTAVVVHFDFIKQKPERIPDNIRKQLQEHLINPEELKKENDKEMLKKE